MDEKDRDGIPVQGDRVQQTDGNQPDDETVPGGPAAQAERVFIETKVLGFSLSNPMRAVLIVLVGIVLPVLVAFAAGIPTNRVGALLMSIVVFQALAVPAGLLIHIPVPALICILLLVAFALIEAIFLVCDLFAESWSRLGLWMTKMESRIAAHPRLYKYGDLMLIALIWIPGIGLYGASLLAWIFRWNTLRGVFFLLAGWMIASVTVLLVTLGAFTVWF